MLSVPKRANDAMHLSMLDGGYTHTHTHIRKQAHRTSVIDGTHMFMFLITRSLWVCSHLMLPLIELEIMSLAFNSHSAQITQLVFSSNFIQLASLCHPQASLYILYTHTIQSNTANGFFPPHPSLPQGSMGTLTPRENWFSRSPSRFGIPRLWFVRVVTVTSSSSRCHWSSAKKSKTLTGAASTSTRASSL